MKTDDPEACRRRERASSTLNALVRAARHREPPEGAVPRISERLMTSGVFAPAQNTLHDSPRKISKFRYYKLATGWWGVGGGGRVCASPRPPGAAGVGRPPPPPVPPGAPAAAGAGGARPPGAPAPATPAAAIALDAPAMIAVSVDALPSAERPGTTANGGATVARPPSLARSSVPAGVRTLEQRNVPPSATELELVQRAQAALVTDPERTLDITREQARLYPDGEYIQEREVFAVEALSRLGRNDEAVRRAEALVQRFPRTPHVTRLERVTGRRLQPPASPSTPTR